MLLMILLGGIVTGLLISAPLGPMAALAALEVSRRHKGRALAVAAGVCAGDLLLAAIAVGVLNVDVAVNLPKWVPVVVAVAVLLAIATWIWKDAEKPARQAGAEERVARGFWEAVVVTVINPGNVAAYLALYSAILPAVAGVYIAGLNNLQTLWLLLATGLGLAVGWGLFLAIIMAAVERFGTLPKRLQVVMARAVSVMMVGAAVLLVVWYFKRLMD